jgi:nucleoside phosphorylase
LSEYKCDFVIITALPEEFDQLEKAIARLQGKLEEVGNNSGIYKGEIGTVEKSFRFYAASQKYPGMVSGATLATRMIERYRPKHIVMVGIAAGFEAKKTPLGSVLIADFVANYQQGKITRKNFNRDGTGLPLNPELKTLLEKNKGAIMRQINEEMAPNRVNLKAYMGPIVTGNQVVASKAVMDNLEKHWRKVIGVEMEGFAIFQTAHEADEPKPLPLLIKSICDYGNKAKNDDYHQLAAYTSADFFLRFAVN